MFSGSVATFAVASNGAQPDDGSVVTDPTPESTTIAPSDPTTTDVPPTTVVPDPVATDPAPETTEPSPVTDPPVDTTPATTTPATTAPATTEPPAPTTTAPATTTTVPETTTTTTVPATTAGPSSIGDLVFVDANSSGDFDGADAGMAGVSVALVGAGPDATFGTGDDTAAAATTGPDGRYLFTDLDAGTYRVTVDRSTLAAELGDTAINTVDEDGGGDSTAVVELGADDDHLTADFGYAAAPTASVEVVVYNDVDRDGERGLGDPAIDGQTVTVRSAGADGVLDTGDDEVVLAITGADGRATADGLADGPTRVTVSGAIVDGLENIEDPDGVADRQSAFVISGAQNPATQFFGFADSNTDVTLPDNVIAGTVWRDVDRNGKVGDAADETRLADVRVAITSVGADGVVGGGDDVVAALIETDANGRFVAPNLADGRYSVAVAGGLPDGLTISSDPDGAIAPDGRAEIDVAGGTPNPDQNFGYALEQVLAAGVGSIGDLVYIDANGNGELDRLEPGVPGQTVELMWAGPDGTLGTADDVTTVDTTDAAGNYLFTELPDGDFKVTVVGGIVDRAANTADPDGGTASQSQLSLFEGDRVRVDQDFGYLGDNGVGDTVYFDGNANGVEDGRDVDPGIVNVSMSATWFGPDDEVGTDDDIVFTTKTNADGTYNVIGLPDGRTTVTLDQTTLPAGSFPSIDPDTGTADGVSSVQLAGGQIDDDQDFGIGAGDGAVGDTVWLDLDRDGVRDLGEPGIAGATVTLTDIGRDGRAGTGDDIVRTTTVDASGGYLFENLGVANYVVAVTGLNLGLVPTFDPDGGDDALSAVALQAGERNLDQDFGFVGSAAVGDTVYIDANGDGVRNEGETGIAGLSIEVSSAGPDGELGTDDDLTVVVVTDANGEYLADGLLGGPTLVSYDESELPGALVPISDLDGGAADTTTVTLANGESNRNVDFIVGDDVAPPPAATVGGITGVVFQDPNRNSRQDTSERGVGGVTVDVLDAGGTRIAQTTTTNMGVFVFGELPAGVYTVVPVAATLPTGTSIVTETDGVVDGRTSVEVVAGAITPSGDFGIASPTTTRTPTTPTSPTNPNTIPRSGTDATSTMAQLALAALMAGLGLLLVRRRPDADLV